MAVVFKVWRPKRTAQDLHLQLRFEDFNAGSPFLVLVCLDMQTLLSRSTSQLAHDRVHLRFQKAVTIALVPGGTGRHGSPRSDISSH